MNSKLKINQIHKEVFIAEGSLIKVGKSDLDFLQKRLSATERKRIRLCAHRGIEDQLQEMFIVLDKNTYIRPHKHLNKAESLHVISGLADAVFFNASGEITQIIPLGDFTSGNQFYYRISEPIYHTLVIYSDVFVFHEATIGPFQKLSTVYAPWSPEENDLAGRKKFTEHLLKKLTHEKIA